MCHQDCINFAKKNFRVEEIKNKSVIEVGSANHNGSVREFIEFLDPYRYIGVDIQDVSGVDVVCNAENLVDYFGQESFDVLISTEMLEHVRNWQDVVSNFKKVLKPNGILLITTRSIGFPYHSAPFDFWRYQIEDMKFIFSDLLIEVLEKDPEQPGVFIKAKKTPDFVENNLAEYPLYSIVKHSRIATLTDDDISEFDQWINKIDLFVRRTIIKLLPSSLRKFIKKRILKLI